MSKKPDFTLSSGRLETRFAEKHPAYSVGAARSESNRCLYCFDAPCIVACPTSIDIPAFIRKIATGNVKGAARTILTANLLGASCAQVCPVEVLCEGACVYVAWGRDPISIGRLQRFAMDHGASTDLLDRTSATGYSVGLVGSGPASLACAGTLALAGHEAVVYERGSVPGGLNTTGVAPYKMRAADALAEVAFIQSLGVRIESGVEIGRDLSVSELLRRHDAIFLGPGLGDDSRLGVKGEKGPGVVGAVEWIRQLKIDPRASIDGVTSAAVVGGGNTALDAARELAQLGVPDVRLVYRRSEKEMRGYRHEWEQAKKEGVHLIAEAAVTEVVRRNGNISGVKLVRTRAGTPTSEALADLPTDLLLIAIGQAKLRALVEQFPGVSLDDRGRIAADPKTGRTGNPRVYTGGDARNGGQEVVNAVHEGQVAARAMDAELRSGALRRDAGGPPAADSRGANAEGGPGDA